MWMNQYLQFLMLAFCGGCIALTVTKGTVFHKMRSWIADRSDFFGDLIHCPYCTSHWVGFFLMVIFHPRMVVSGNIFFDYIATTFALIFLIALSAGTVFKLFWREVNN
jgi:hypothetical protein